jgi:hypothetical protein
MIGSDKMMMGAALMPQTIALPSVENPAGALDVLQSFFSLVDAASGPALPSPEVDVPLPAGHPPPDGILSADVAETGVIAPAPAADSVASVVEPAAPRNPQTVKAPTDTNRSLAIPVTATPETIVATPANLIEAVAASPAVATGTPAPAVKPHVVGNPVRSEDPEEIPSKDQLPEDQLTQSAKNTPLPAVPPLPVNPPIVAEISIRIPAQSASVPAVSTDAKPLVPEEHAVSTATPVKTGAQSENIPSSVSPRTAQPVGDEQPRAPLVRSDPADPSQNLSSFGTIVAQHSAAPEKPAPVTHPPISVQTGAFGRELGVAIAHHTTAGIDEMTLRLDPAHHGQIEVKLSFNDDGQLRATVSTTQPATLDMLRRESADLTRALSDAGIQTDTQSFRFDSQSGSSGQQQQARSSFSRMSPPPAAETDDYSPPDHRDPAPFRPLRGGRRVNLVA